MPRGRRRASPDVTSLEQQLQELRDREALIRQQLRRLRNSSTEIRKLEEKLGKQFAGAKWTVNQIKELDANWDVMKFYDSVTAKAPTPRGRRRRTAEPV